MRRVASAAALDASDFRLAPACLRNQTSEQTLQAGAKRAGACNYGDNDDASKNGIFQRTDAALIARQGTDET
jgi:hypothetical protein